MPQHTPNTGESKSDFMARCQEDGGTHDECVLRFDRARGLSILAFSNDTEIAFVPHVDNPMFFDKDIIKVGTYKHPADGWTMDVTVEMIDGLVDKFDLRKSRGIHTEVVVDHGQGADDVVGYLEGMRREGDRLIATHGMTCQRGVDLANTVKNVSVMIDHDCKDGKGNEYGEAITHSAICQQPVVPGQDSFVKLSLNNQAEQQIPVLFLSAGATEDPMKKTMLASIKAMTGTNDEVTETNAMSLLEAHVTKMSTAKAEATTKIASLEGQIKILNAAKPTDKTIDPDDLDDRAETAEDKFDGLVENGKITPNVAAELKLALIGLKGTRNAFALSTRISGGDETIVKKVIKALAQNDITKLGEQTGMQVLEKTSAVGGGKSNFNEKTFNKMLSMSNGKNGNGSDVSLKEFMLSLSNDD